MVHQQICTQCGASNPSHHTFCFQCGAAFTPKVATVGAPAPTGLLQPQRLLKQRYRIERRVGKGGMGAVYLAEDLSLGNRRVAVKEMSQSGLAPHERAEAVDNFRREALLLARLHHPHLPSIYEHFFEDGRWYLVMSFIEGQTLAAYLKQFPNTILPLEEVLSIGIQLCIVLDYLHTHQPPIIFRDLKPSNIMRTSTGHLYLIDFGIARHFKPGQARDTLIIGTLGYAPPEQYGQAQSTPRSDIYSLGATLHQCLSGQNPAQSPFRFAPLPGQQSREMHLTACIMQMVELDESKRPASIALVKQQLQQIATMQETPHQMPAAPPIAKVPIPVTVSPPTVQIPRNTHALPPGTLLYTMYPSSFPSKLVITWFSDGDHLATVSSDGTLQTWNAITGQLLMNYPLPYQHLRLVAWSPDSNRVALVSSSDRKTIQVWDARGQRPLTTYASPKGVVDAVAWSPDSMRIASSTSHLLGWTSQTIVWSADTGQALSPLSRLRSSYSYDIAWSPNNVHIGSNEGATIKIWDAETGKIILKRDFSESKVEDPAWFLKVRDFAWSPDGTCIAMTMLYSRQRKEFTRYAFKQWERTTYPVTYKEHRRAIGRWDLPSTYRTIYQDKVEQNPPKVQVWTALSWSPDGTRIAVAGSEGIIHVRDAKTGFLFLTCDVGVSVTAILWSPDGTRIAVQLEKSVQVWQVM